MNNKNRIYFCIDMKSFYASCECAERNLNPFETNLVVSDVTRGKNAICLAVSPKLKAMGVGGRCRLSEIPPNVEYIAAMPRMQMYIDYAARIYGIYLRHIDKRDIYVYSIDESFIDATDYLKMYNLTAVEFAKELINEISEKLRIPATAGIGTNLYLAKIALDITAKHVKDHIGYLDEKLYKETLWKHRPLTDFWMVGPGKSARLAKYGIFDMEGISKAPKELMYKTFGVDAELLIDHANGIEPCTIEDIKNYKGKSNSVSTSQILPRNYSYEEAWTVIKEMTDNLCLELARRHVIANTVFLMVSYGDYNTPSTGARSKMFETTAVDSVILVYVKEIYEHTTYKDVPIRRIALGFENVVNESAEGYNLFTNFEEKEKERKLQNATIDIKVKYGKNAILKGINLCEEGTQKERNEMIGGHKA